MAVESPRWDAAREALRQRLSAHVYTSWISRMTVLEDDGTVLRLGLPDQFAVDWVNTHYRKLLEEEVRPWSLELSMARTDETLIPQPSTLPTPALAVPSSLPMPASSSSLPAPAQVSSLPTPAPVHESMIPTLVPTGGSEGQLNARYTFQSFVSGPANELAYSACQAIVESRMPIYNPLVLVGSTGLGQGVAHREPRLPPRERERQRELRLTEPGRRRRRPEPRVDLGHQRDLGRQRLLLHVERHASPRHEHEHRGPRVTHRHLGRR